MEMIDSLYYLDRYRNEGTRTYSAHADYSEALPRYRPTTDIQSFNLKTFKVPREELNIYTANPPDTLEALYLFKEHALFCVHPQVLADSSDDYYIEHLQKTGQPGEDLVVSPSSSTRTLYVTSSLPHALKIHFPFRVSRYGRKMRDEVIEQAINVSRELENGSHCFDDDFAFLREVIGIAFRPSEHEADRGENWGYLVRDMRPFPPVEEKRYLVPGFALYGRDFFDRSLPPLLYDIIGNSDPLQLVVQDIMIPIISHWVHCFRHFGFMLEPHGQNVILEIDDEQNIRRIVHRDLSLGIDMRRRNDLNAVSTNLNRYNRMDHGEFNSITYDMFMGSHFFDRLIVCCQDRYPKLSAHDFYRPCQQKFNELFPDSLNYFPETIHYFSEQRDQFNKPLYKDTGKKTIWR